MSENKFDKVIAEHLKEVEMPYEPASWDALQAKLDQLPPATPPDAGPNAFDQRMRAMLEEVDMPYQPMHWDKMAQQLDHSAVVRRVRAWKMAEIAAVFLLAINLQVILDNGTRWFHMPRPQETTPEAAPDMASSSRQKGNRTIASGLYVPALLPTASLAQNASALTTHTTLYNAHNASQAVHAATITTPAETVNLPGSINQALVDANGQPLPKGLRPLTLLAALGLDHIEQLQPKSPAMAALLTPQPKKAVKKSSAYLMAYGGADQQSYTGKSGYSTKYNTVNGGIRAGKRNGKWGMEAGIEFAPVAFAPEDDVIGFYKQNGRVLATKYDRVRANMVSVPARLTRQIVRVGRTSVHAVAGLTAHFAANKSYEFRDEELVSSPSSLSNDQPTLPQSKGIFENGTLYGNSYLTTDASVRVEHRLNRRMAAYVEPQYRRHANGRGVGPNASKNNAIGVQAGVIAMIY
jgi:hypothetical protein